MNVEVEVVRETVTTYLVQDVRSLEEGERRALLGEGRRLSQKRVKPYVQVSFPVIVRDGEVVE